MKAPGEDARSPSGVNGDTGDEKFELLACPESFPDATLFSKPSSFIECVERS